MTTQTTLKPCPFCGGRAELIGGNKDPVVYCMKCCAHSRGASTKRKAMEYWNERIG